MPAGHTLPLTFAFDFTASYFRISSVVPEPEPVIFKRFRLRFRPQPSGSTGSGSGSASLVRPRAIQRRDTIRYDTRCYFNLRSLVSLIYRTVRKQKQ